MHIEQKAEGNSLLFELRGSLSGTANSTIQLFERLTVAIEKHPEGINLDMQKVSYIDSMSLGLLMGALLKCQQHKVGFRLRNLPAQIRNLLESTNLQKAFPDLF